MQADEFIERLRQQPFQPFRLQMADGRVFEIRRPELVAVSRTEALIFFPHRKYPSPPAFDRFDAIDYSDISGLEPLPSEPAPTAPQ